LVKNLGSSSTPNQNLESKQVVCTEQESQFCFQVQFIKKIKSDFGSSQLKPESMVLIHTKVAICLESVFNSFFSLASEFQTTSMPF
jgi:hypothetical protein